MSGKFLDWAIDWAMATLIFGPILFVGAVIYYDNTRELGPLLTFHVECNNGSATVKATEYGRYKEGPRFFDVNGKRRATQSFPPDCFVTVER